MNRDLPKARPLAIRLAAAVLVAGAFAGCEPGPALSSDEATPAVIDAVDDGFYGRLIDPPLRPPRVVLRDTEGRTVDLSRPAPGAATVLFFGFTHCDDVCPTTIADLAFARRSLPPALNDRVIVLFVTVDPDRDTPAVLKTWLRQFDSDFIGLRGPTGVVHQAERSLYLPESSPAAPTRSPSPPADHHRARPAEEGYSVDHAGSVYVFGPGDTSLLYTGGTTPKQYADDLHRLLTT